MSIAYRETSREAWESMIPIAAELDHAIMTALKTGPTICQDIEATIERSHQSVSGNLRHLVENGYVEPSGEFGQTQSGRRAIKWRIVPAMRVAIEDFARADT